MTIFQKRLIGDNRIWGAIFGQGVAIAVVWVTMASEN